MKKAENVNYALLRNFFIYILIQFWFKNRLVVYFMERIPRLGTLYSQLKKDFCSSKDKTKIQLSLSAGSKTIIFKN